MGDGVAAEVSALHWLVYNWRVIRIEMGIIIPATVAMASTTDAFGQAPLVADACHVDEAYHVYLHRQAVADLVARRPAMAPIAERLPEPAVVVRHGEFLDALPRHDRP